MDVLKKILKGEETMAVKTKEEIMEAVKSRIGEDTSDEALAFIEDITDTLDSLSSTNKDETDWKEKYEQNDKEWREKYTKRFFSKPVGGDDPDPDPEPQTDPEPSAPKTFDELFKEGE